MQDLKEELRTKEEELFNCKRDIRNTKHIEFETENNILMNEWVRLRAIIDQLLAQMNSGQAQEQPIDNGSTPSRKERRKDDMIQNLLQANEQFQKVDQEKDHKIIELQEQLHELDSKFNKKNAQLQEVKRNHMKLVKAKNKEISTLKEQLEAAPKKEIPINRSIETKQKDKEALGKVEKELTRIKSDLKRYKDNDKKLKDQITDLEQEKHSHLLEIKELKRKLNAWETKIDLLKRKESDLEKAIEGRSSQSQKDEQVSSGKIAPERPYEDQYFKQEIIDVRTKDETKQDSVPQMKPIISHESDGEQEENDPYEFDIDSDGKADEAVPQPKASQEVEVVKQVVTERVVEEVTKPATEHKPLASSKPTSAEEVVNPSPVLVKEEVIETVVEVTKEPEPKASSILKDEEDDYSDEKYDSDEDGIMKEPEPRSEEDTKSDHKPRNESAHQESINEKSSAKPGQSDAHEESIHQQQDQESEKAIDDDYDQDEYDQDEFENLKSERVKQTTQPEEAEQSEHNLEEEEEVQEREPSHTPDSPKIEEEDVDPLHFNQPQPEPEQEEENEEEEYDVDEVPAKPTMPQKRKFYSFNLLQQLS